MQFDVLLV